MVWCNNCNNYADMKDHLGNFKTHLEENMKKTFVLTHLKKKRDRLVEAVRHEVNKYIKRERNKKLPEGVDFWDFDCKFGHSAEEAKEIHLSEINKCIDEVEERQLETFYLEILAKPGHRMKKPIPHK